MAHSDDGKERVSSEPSDDGYCSTRTPYGGAFSKENFWGKKYKIEIYV